MSGGVVSAEPKYGPDAVSTPEKDRKVGTWDAVLAEVGSKGVRGSGVKAGRRGKREGASEVIVVNKDRQKRDSEMRVR